MNVVIEVVAAEGVALMVMGMVVVFVTAIMRALTSVVTTSIAFVLQQGGTSQNAVSPTNNFEGSLAVA